MSMNRNDVYNGYTTGDLLKHLGEKVNAQAALYRKAYMYGKSGDRPKEMMCANSAYDTGRNISALKDELKKRRFEL